MCSCSGTCAIGVCDPGFFCEHFISGVNKFLGLFLWVFFFLFSGKFFFYISLPHKPRTGGFFFTPAPFFSLSSILFLKNPFLYFYISFFYSFF